MDMHALPSSCDRIGVRVIMSIYRMCAMSVVRFASSNDDTPAASMLTSVSISWPQLHQRYSSAFQPTDHGLEADAGDHSTLSRPTTLSHKSTRTSLQNANPFHCLSPSTLRYLLLGRPV